MRTARSRTSGENLFDLFMAQSSQRVEPPQNPGRFKLLTRRGELLITQVQPPGQRRRAVATQALGVRYCDQQQIQRGRARLAAVDEVLLYERVASWRCCEWRS